MKTYTPKPNEVEKKWFLVDAEGKVLGRLASKVAQILLGKGKPKFTPHFDQGDFVVVINCDKVILTGKKADLKTYYHYTGYPGGLKKETFSKRIKENPREVFIHSVKGMLPHNRLGRKILSKLFVYLGEKHPHQAQKPEPIKL
jgi:large subunit ribosomal protein L13